MPTRVACFLGEGRALPGDYDVDDRAILLLEFPSGVVADVTCCFITQPSNRQIVLHGLQGAMDVTADRLTLYDAAGVGATEAYTEGSHSLAPQLEAFISAVREGTLPPSACEEAYDVQRIIDAAYRSAASGCAERPVG
jgi:predicted dehydrogenase